MFKLWEKWQRHALGVANLQLGNDYDDGTVDPVTVVCTDCYQTFDLGEDGHECTVLNITNG